MNGGVNETWVVWWAAASRGGHALSCDIPAGWRAVHGWMVSKLGRRKCLGENGYGCDMAAVIELTRRASARATREARESRRDRARRRGELPAAVQ
jgi:hypothetical protein